MFKSVFIYILGIFLLLFNNCNSKQQELQFAPPQFKDTIKIKGQVFNDKFIMGTGDDIDHYQNTLIVNAFQGVEKGTVHFFDISTGTHIKSILPKGRGPGEAMVVRELNVNHEAGEVIFYDFTARKLCHFNIDSVIGHDNQRDYVICQPYPIYMYSVYSGKDNYIANGGLRLDSGEIPRFSIIKKDSIIFSYCTFPEVSIPGVPNGISISYNYCHVNISPNQSKLICASGYGAILEIFDIYENKIVLDTIKGFYRPIFEADKNEIIKSIPNQTINGFTDLYVTNKHIYTIFNDTSQSQNQNIAVFDLEGNSIRLYQCDYKLNKICINEEKNKLYAIAINKDYETLLVEFNLN